MPPLEYSAPVGPAGEVAWAKAWPLEPKLLDELNIVGLAKIEVMIPVPDYTWGGFMEVWLEYYVKTLPQPIDQSPMGWREVGLPHMFLPGEDPREDVSAIWGGVGFMGVFTGEPLDNTILDSARSGPSPEGAFSVVCQTGFVKLNVNGIIEQVGGDGDPIYVPGGMIPGEGLQYRTRILLGAAVGGEDMQVSDFAYSDPITYLGSGKLMTSPKDSISAAPPQDNPEPNQGG